MIRSFRCTDTRSLANGWAVPRFQAIERVARRKIRQLEIASRLDDLRIPAGNRLEALRPPVSAKLSTRFDPSTRGLTDDHENDL
jgi:proteic killer suppression protein